MGALTPLLTSVELEFGLAGNPSWENLKAAVEGSGTASNDDVTRLLLQDNLRMKQQLAAISAIASTGQSVVSLQSEEPQEPRQPEEPSAIAMRG